MDGLFLKDFMGIIIKRIWVILIICIICTGAVAYTSYFVKKPVYKASTSLYVINKNLEDNNQLSIDQANIQASRQMLSDYSQLLSSYRITSGAIAELGLRNITPEEFADKISINLKSDTSVFEITAEDNNPLKAKDIANVVSQVFIKEIRQITNQDNISIIDEARLPKYPAGPNHARDIIPAFILSLFGAASLIMCLEYMNNTVRTVEEVEKILGYSVIGMVPSMDIK